MKPVDVDFTGVVSAKTCPPCPVGEHPMDWAASLDRAWFEGNPDQSEYWRVLVPGEAPPLEEPSPGRQWYVRVRRVAPGVRLKRFFESVVLTEEPREETPWDFESSTSREWIEAQDWSGGIGLDMRNRVVWCPDCRVRIPYVVVTEECARRNHGRPVEKWVAECPSCPHRFQVGDLT